jgi:hypothetical protein
MRLRNEANWGCKGFGFSRLRGGLRGRLLRLGLGAFGLQALQIHDGLALQAVGVIDAAL